MYLDFLCRGTLPELETRFSVVSCTAACNEAVVAHNLEPVAAHLICRAIGAAALLSPLLNDTERFTIRWEYPGVLNSIMADIGADCDLRALINPASIGEGVESLDKLFGEAGTVAVTKSDQPTGRVLASGTSEAVLHDVVEDLAHHFAVSDQLETALAVLVQFAPDPARPVRQCYGIMLQAMPDCDLEQFDDLRKRLLAPEVRSILEAGERDEDFASEVLNALTHDLDCSCQLYPGPAPVYRCGCSHDSSVAMLQTLPVAERDEIRGSGEAVRVRCHFCAKTYEIAPGDVP